MAVATADHGCCRRALASPAVDGVKEALPQTAALVHQTLRLPLTGATFQRIFDDNVNQLHNQTICHVVQVRIVVDNLPYTRYWHRHCAAVMP